MADMAPSIARLQVAVWTCALCAAIGPAATPATAQEEPTPDADLILLDDDLACWYNLAPSAEQVATGQTAALWESVIERPWVEMPEPPTDWTAYASLQLQVFAESANGQRLRVRAYTDNPIASFASYSTTFTLREQGWQTITLPIWDFQADDNPSGWGHIEHLNIIGGPPEVEALADTRLFLDDIRLVREPPEEVVLLSEELSAWPQLEETAEEAHSGTVAGLWGSPVRKPWVERAHPPRDWTPYKALTLWAHSRADNGQEVRVRLYTGDPAKEFDSYWASFYVEWEGWREVTLPLERFEAALNPAGWDHITHMTLCAGGAEVVPMRDTHIILDDVRLVK